MDSGVTVFLDHALRDQDRILEVVAIPGHERHQHVLAQGQLAQVGGRAVGQYIALGNHVTHAHQRTLVHAGVLVGALVLHQVVDIHTRVTDRHLVFIGPHHDATGIHLLDHAATARNRGYARVGGNRALHAGAHQRLFSTQGRNSLALHV